MRAAELMLALAQAIESWPLAEALRRSIWVYPLVNTGHLLGLALLIGAIVPMDLRLLGAWQKRVDVPTLAGVLLPVAATGLFVAMLSGALLFVARAVDYAGSVLFQVKLLVLLAAVINLALLHRHPAWQRAIAGGPVGKRVKLAAALSLVGWLSVLLLGRLVGYR